VRLVYSNRLNYKEIGDSVTAAKVWSEAELHELAAWANKYHAEAEEASQTMLTAAWNAGQVLLAAKTLCEHGEWIAWLEANFQGSVRTAQVYMQLAKAQTSAHLQSSVSINAALEAISEDTSPGTSKGKSGKASKESLPSRELFAKRWQPVQEDVLYIVQTASADEDFAAAAHGELDNMVELRTMLSKLIKQLRTKFKDGEA
jgi:hypothetical protein